MNQFRVITQALRDTLGTYAAGLFKVTGFEGQGKDAREIKNIGEVQVFFAQGTFPKSGGTAYGPRLFNINFDIGISVSASARLDLATINNPGATNGQKIAALSALREAAQVADEKWDLIAAAVDDIVMAGQNDLLGLPEGSMSNRWVESVSKDDPLPNGDLVMLNGTVRFTCTVSEEAPGETPTMAEGISATIAIGQATGVTGVSVTVS